MHSFLFSVLFAFLKYKLIHCANATIKHNITLYTSTYVSLSHNYQSKTWDTAEMAEKQYPFYLNSICNLSIGYPSNKYPIKMVLYCANYQFGSNTTYIDLNIGKNIINNYQLNSSLLYNESGDKKYDFFWFGQLILSVFGSDYNATLGANATLFCYNLTICNKQNYCIQDIQN